MGRFFFSSEDATPRGLRLSPGLPHPTRHFLTAYKYDLWKGPGMMIGTVDSCPSATPPLPEGLRVRTVTAITRGRISLSRQGRHFVCNTYVPLF